MEQEIKKLFYELGIVVYLVDKKQSLSHTTLYFNVDSIKQLCQIEKSTKLISTFLRKDIKLKQSSISHFAISIPNNKSENVNLCDKKYNKIFTSDNKLKIFAGINEDGDSICISLDEIPHILIAGTTGSGKSVMINGIICGLLKQKSYNFHLTMIDTKRVELSPYKKLGSEWCSVSTNPIDAVEILKNLCDDLEVRYEIMEENGWRKIPEHYYKEIVIIEELGDLMMTSKGVVEKYIVKLAQLGRACGMHLIIATQRPTVDVVTGSIKANIDCRFALKTTSGIDSRNILGHNGAEKLRGSGDCLLKLPNKADEIHIQCPFVSDDNILKIIKEF